MIPPVSPTQQTGRPLDASLRARWLLALGAAVILLVLAAAVALVVNLQHRALEGQKRELLGLAKIISAEAQRALQGARGAQIDIGGRILRRAADTGLSFQQAASDARMAGVLQGRLDELPYAEAIFVVDRQGNVINASRAWRGLPRRVDDSEYFRALMTDDMALDYLSRPARGAGGTWAVDFARKIVDDDGGVHGLIVARLRPDDFARFYGQLNAGEGVAIALFRDDGIMLAGYPVGDEFIGKRLVTLQPARGVPVVVDGRAVRLISLRDHQPHLVAAARQSGFPTLVAVSLSMEEVGAIWHRDALAVAAGALLLAGIVALYVALARRHMRLQRQAAGAAYTMARTDGLTGLANRLMFTEKLDERLMQVHESGEGCAVLLLNLDAFKYVNDSLGQAMGNQVLQTVAARLGEVAQGQLVARLSGDEFAVLQQPSNGREAAALAARIIAAVGQPWFSRNYRVVPATSIGIALYPSQADNAEQLLKNASTALSRAKAEGRGRALLFEPGMAQDRARRRVAELALRDALENDGFELHYQPQLDTSHGRLRGFEALLRWRHPHPDQLQAPQVIGVAEETGLIVPLGKWALESACAQAATWPGALRVAVNVSGWQFRSGELVNHVRHALQASGLPPARLEIEITESVLLENTAEVRNVLQELRELGVCISLDDFGTGYSSLLYLRRFPSDRIKIDITFVRDVCTNVESARIVRAIIDLGHSLGMETTAEGVETREQWEELRRAGCTEVQGHYIGVPLPAAELQVYFEKYAGSIAIH